jgi:hypothetical protein
MSRTPAPILSPDDPRAVGARNRRRVFFVLFGIGLGLMLLLDGLIILSGQPAGENLIGMALGTVLFPLLFAAYAAYGRAAVFDTATSPLGGTDGGIRLAEFEQQRAEDEAAQGLPITPPTTVTEVAHWDDPRAVDAFGRRRKR